MKIKNSSSSQDFFTSSSIGKKRKGGSESPFPIEKKTVGLPLLNLMKNKENRGLPLNPITEFPNVVVKINLKEKKNEKEKSKVIYF